MIRFIVLKNSLKSLEIYSSYSEDRYFFRGFDLLVSIGGAPTQFEMLRIRLAKLKNKSMKLLLQ